MDKNLNYFRISLDGPFAGKEIIYDVKSNMLSNAGLVISKQFEGKDAYFKVRKISTLSEGYKRPGQKFNLSEVHSNEEPKNFPVQIANAIANAYSGAFTIDLVSVVRQTIPKIQIDVKGLKYFIHGGTGYEGVLLYEEAVYKDITTGKKVKRNGFTLKLPTSEKWNKESQEIIDTIEHYCKELYRYELGRFEIAQRLLYPEPFKEEKPKEDE